MRISPATRSRPAKVKRVSAYAPIEETNRVRSTVASETMALLPK
jgi:hypothetical protein